MINEVTPHAPHQTGERIAVVKAERDERPTKVVTYRVVEASRHEPFQQPTVFRVESSGLSLPLTPALGARTAWKRDEETSEGR